MSESSKSGNHATKSTASGIRHLFANAEFNELAGVLSVAGKPISLEPRPVRLLVELLRRANEVVTKDELFETVWEGRVTVDHVLANAVSKLRAALGEEAGARIVNIPRVGYRLNGPVRRVPVEAPPLELAPGASVPGREGYVLVQRLGPTERSQVWLARHAKLGQSHVFKFADDATGLASLKREYTLYRLLQAELGPRADFARVFDAQFVGAPYHLECEFGGTNLADWAEEGGRLASMPLQARLDIFVSIARAVAAAHSVGVIHKDLKPSNVLMAPITDAAEPHRWQIKLTDFGSSQLLDPAKLEALKLTAMGLSQAGTLTADALGGTLLYMAPELLAGQPATVQSDVYALGLMLYQLVTADLRQPLTSGWQGLVDDVLLRDDIAAATTAKPQDRIQSVAELVDRLLSLEARRSAQIAAQRAAEEAALMALQLQRLQARRPWMFTALASLGIGLGVSVWFAIQSRTALLDAKQQAARADAINQFMSVDLLSGLDVVRVGKDATVSIRDVLARAAVRVGERFKDQPEIEALTRGRLADLYSRVGLYNEALEQYEQLFALELRPAEDSALVDFHFGYAAMLAQMSKIKEARAELAVAERKHASLSATQQADLELAATQAKYLVQTASQNYQAALPLARRAVELIDGPAKTDPIRSFNARIGLGEVLYRLAQLPEAEQVLAAAIQAQPIQQVGVAMNARARIALARVQIAAGKTTDAEIALVSARDELAAFMGGDNHDVAVANVELGNLYDARGDFSRSAAVLMEAYRGMSATLGAEHSNTRIVGLNLAISEINAGRPASGLGRLEQGRTWFVQNAGGEEGPVAQAIDFERARALTTLGRASEALRLLTRLQAERLAEATPARDWADRIQAERGRALIALGQRPEGLSLVQAALPHLRANGSSAWVIEEFERLIESRLSASSR